MGKEWFSWGGAGGGGGGGISRSSTFRREKMKEAATASAGCISAFYNLFSFQLHRNTHPTTYPFLPQEATTLTGLEAPRNSLDLAMKHEENLNFPVGIKIKTRISRLDDIHSESSSCNSPGTKTPSVVARLMGLDLLPESNSPSILNPRKDTSLLRSTFSDVRSLPETPRTSSSSRKSDVECHRLSLQINKENVFKEELSLSDRKIVRRRGILKNDDDRRSFGLDITNANRNSDKSNMSQNLFLLKPAKNSKLLSKNGEEGCPRSPRLNIKTATITSKISRISSCYDIINHQARDSKKPNNGKCFKKLPTLAAAVDSVTKSRRDEGLFRSRERNKSRLADGQLEKTLVRVNSCTSRRLHTKLPRKQSQVSNNPSHSYFQLHHKLFSLTPCSTNGGATPLHGGASRDYVEKILKNSSIINPLAARHTPSQPTIFGFQEFEDSAVSGRRSERKLIFQLVDELLGQISTRRFKLASPVGCFPSVEELCKRIESFPAAKCVVLEDIDSLIERDLCENGYWRGEEEIISEIEGEIVEWLVREAVAVMGGAAAEDTETGVCRVGL